MLIETSNKSFESTQNKQQYGTKITCTENYLHRDKGGGRMGYAEFKMLQLCSNFLWFSRIVPPFNHTCSLAEPVPIDRRVCGTGLVNLAYFRAYISRIYISGRTSRFSFSSGMRVT